MSEGSAADAARAAVDSVYRSDSRRVLATLIRLLGDFDVAEEAMHAAFAAAVEQWARDGLPTNPRAWLVSAGRFKAIDSIRRRVRFDASQEELVRQIEANAAEADVARGVRPRPLIGSQRHAKVGKAVPPRSFR